MLQTASFLSDRGPASPAATSSGVVQRVVSKVAADFEVDEQVLMASTRGAPRAAFARQVAMYLAHVVFAMNFAAVGRLFGRDRTTVAHACRVIEDGRDDGILDSRLAALERACRCNPIRQTVDLSACETELDR